MKPSSPAAMQCSTMMAIQRTTPHLSMLHCSEGEETAHVAVQESWIVVYYSERAAELGVLAFRLPRFLWLSATEWLA